MAPGIWCKKCLGGSAIDTDASIMALCARIFWSCLTDVDMV